MNLRSVAAPLYRQLKSVPGWKTKRKIVVFESDDWGGIRTPNMETYLYLTSKGMDLDTQDAHRYSTNDSLANSVDLQQLFSTLASVKDRNGNAPVFTAISNVANPDFKKIQENNFKTFYYEPFTETLTRYYPQENVFSYWQEGINKRLFMPQFHGREHLNVAVWMKALQEGDNNAHLAFEKGLWSYNNKHPYNIYYQAAFELNDISELTGQAQIIKDGLNLFERLFGYRATLFVPPNGYINNSLEVIAAENGIRFMSTSKVQHETLGQGRMRKVFHYTGQKNGKRQRYLTRNCFFEPSQIGKAWVESCLADISMAFRWRNPVIIGTHRVNYIGAINPLNREQGNLQLQQLLTAMIATWPDIEFMTSSELGELIEFSRR
jgi:hypothetical protein